VTSSSRAVYANPPDWPEMLVWMGAPLRGEIFVDVGANIGLYSLLTAELGATVIAVEPAADAFRRLRENIDLNGYDIQAERIVLAGEPGEAFFTQDRGAVNRIVLPGEDKAAQPTAVTTLDVLLGDRTAAGVKVDVEGAEALVLAGASKALAGKRIRLLQLEWNQRSFEMLGQDRRPIEEALRGYGYELLRPDPFGRLLPVENVSVGRDIFARPVADRSNAAAP